jgi:hypothetical protein
MTAVFVQPIDGRSGSRHEQVFGARIGQRFL